MVLCFSQITKALTNHWQFSPGQTGHSPACPLWTHLEGSSGGTWYGRPPGGCVSGGGGGGGVHMYMLSNSIHCVGENN